MHIVTSANPHEVKLLQQVIDDCPIPIKPIVGDRAYDSDPHDPHLKKQGIELIAAHKKNRKAPQTQDQRKLKRSHKRWVVERFFAWTQWARRLLSRFDKLSSVFQDFLDIFSSMILLKKLI